MVTPMPKAGAEPLHYPSSKPAFPKLFEELAGNGKRWLDAELALAKAEAVLRVRGYATGLAVAFAGLAILIAATVILAQAGVAALTPLVGGPAVAGLLVGAALLVVVLGSAFVAKNLLVSKTPPIGLIFRWLSGDEKGSGVK